jgi:capsular polysaccharide biosynthesis protein
VDTVSPRADGTTISAALIQQLTTRYVAYASSSQVAEQVADDLGLEADVVKSSTTVRLPERTTNLFISVSMPDADDAARVASELSERTRQSSVTDPLLTVNSLVPGVVAQTPDSSGRPQRLAAATLVAILIGVAAARMADALSEARVRRRSSGGARGVEPVGHGPDEGDPNPHAGTEQDRTAEHHVARTGR